MYRHRDGYLHVAPLIWDLDLVDKTKKYMLYEICLKCMSLRYVRLKPHQVGNLFLLFPFRYSKFMSLFSYQKKNHKYIKNNFEELRAWEIFSMEISEE